jgi:hypothetical protein
MSYGIVLEFNGVSQAQYDAINGKLGIDSVSGKGDWPPGLISHAAGPVAGGGWVVTEVWESKAAQEAFMSSRLGAELAAAGVPAPSHVIETDLVSYHTP